MYIVSMMGDKNVSFQIDTDNRENFPSAIAFQAFRKQRDSFYEILRIWEENHSVSGWAFQIALGGKIRSMLTLHNDATNYCHFARLFKSQLLVSCIQEKQQENEMDDESLSILRTLKHINPTKLTQLTKRLVTPLPSKDHIQGPCFPGVQEFFKDFILHAFNPIFYTHLENCLVHDIMELNDTHFTGSEIEDSDTMVDEQTQENFITCLYKLRLLAKVLGLLISLPYRSESNITKDIIATQVEIRSRVLPSLNLEACLQNAVVQGKLSLTIPWIVKYLAMMDSVSLRLPYYSQILELLYYIYWIVNHCDFSASDSLISQQTAILLKSTLNWLFELSNFPKDQYLTWQKSCKTRELRSLRHLDKHCIQKNTILLTESVAPVTPAKCNIDKLDLINDRVLRMCCPLTELKVPSLVRRTNVNNGNMNKHITPVSSLLAKSNASAKMKYLELQLEEAFFHGQPASTRKTVDFVSERVASVCVKHICNTLLSSSRDTNLNIFRKLVRERQNERQSEYTEETLPNNIETFKSLLQSDMNGLALSASKELRDQCEKVIPPICEVRVTKSIKALLAEDSSSSVKDTCIKIASRMAIDRINQWIQSHIVGGSLFIKDMEIEMNRFLRNNSPTHTVRRNHHNPNAASPTDAIDELRSVIWDLLDNGGKCLTIVSLSSTVDKLQQSLTERADLQVGPEKILLHLSTDLALFLVAYNVDLFKEEIQEKLIKIWTMSDLKTDSNSPLHRLLSPRNIMLLAQPENDDIWLAYGTFLRKLLDKNVINIDSLSDQCVALFRHEWPAPTLKSLSKCLTEATTNYNASDENAEKVKYLLGWIAETYHEIEIFDESDFGG